MDNPWANAWGEPAKSNVDSISANWVSSTATSDVQDSEADIAMPSWATGAGVKWAEPSDVQTFSWDATIPAKEWSVSPYDNIHLGKGSVDELPQPSGFPPPEPIEPSPPPSSSPLPTVNVINDEEPEDVTPTSSPTTSSLNSMSPPGSPDAFGTFETALDNEEPNTDPWSHSGVIPNTASLEADAWGGPGWGAAGSAADIPGDDHPLDEWEAAKQQKEKQDRHVPPQVLASILHQFEEISLELWPVDAEGSNQDGYNRSQDRQIGIEGVNGLMSAAERLIPQNLMLPSHVHFPKTFTSKHMGESLRFTRHVTTTHSSPMAIYLASKGSTAWETFVKSRPENSKDDLLPPGWRVIEKEKDDTQPVADAKKKTSSGLLSFFGRRNPASPPAVSSSRPESPVRPPSSASVTIPSISTNVDTSRASVDNNNTPQIRPSTPVAFLSSTKLPVTSPLESPSPVPALNSIPSISSSLPQPNAPETATPTSAVSRFLNRFSRSRTTGASPRNSLALSTDDLEFLSDIVPSANDEVDEASQLRELSSMIGSSPLPTKLPPPLPPPPRLLPLATASSDNLTPNNRNVIQSSDAHDDPLSMFNSSVTKSPISPTTSEPQAPHFSTRLMSPLVANPSSSSTSMAQGFTSPSTNQTPSLFDFPPPPASTPKIYTPPQKQTPVAIMSKTATSTSSPNTSFTFLPPPPSSRILPPPSLNTGSATAKSTTQTSMSTSSQRPQQLTVTESDAFGSLGDDDFSDFHSTPVIATTSFESNISSVFSDKSLISSSSASTSGTRDFIDDFDDFVSSPTPLPPRPPEKLNLLAHKSSQKPLPSPSSSQTKPQPRRVSRAADHQRTMSLLDIAATRQGRWPAPASPLPHALPPPPANITPAGFGHLDGASALTSSISSPPTFIDPDMSSQLNSIPPPMKPARSPPPQLRASLSSMAARQNGNIKPNLSGALSTSPSTAGLGGLSAQDLSFFEGI